MRTAEQIAERRAELVASHLAHGKPEPLAGAYAAAVIAAEELVQGTLSLDQHRLVISAVDAMLAAVPAQRVPQIVPSYTVPTD